MYTYVYTVLYNTILSLLLFESSLLGATVLAIQAPPDTELTVANQPVSPYHVIMKIEMTIIYGIVLHVVVIMLLYIAEKSPCV